MGIKIRVGMLCKFKEHSSMHWVGYAILPTKRSQRTSFRPAITSLQEPIFFGKRHVTALEKRGVSMGTDTNWVSWTKVLGRNKNGDPVIAWVQSYLLKAVQESRKSQSND